MTHSPEEKAREIIDRAANQADYLDIQAAYQKFISIIAEALREASHPSHSKRKKGRRQMKKFIYLDSVTNAPLMIVAKKRPSKESMPKSGTWVIREWFSGSIGSGKWDIPCFPEITFELIEQLKFVGEVNP